MPRGYISTAMAAVLWASSATVGKFLFQHGMSPLELVQTRITLSALMMLLYRLVVSKGLPRIELRDMWRFVITGGVGMAMLQATYFLAVSKIQVAAAILLEYTAPFLVMLYTAFFWGEKVTRAKITSLFMAFVGCFLVVGGYRMDIHGFQLSGILYGFLAAVFFAGYSLMGEGLMRRYPPWTVLFYAMLFASVTWNVLQPPLVGLKMLAGWMEASWMAYIVTIGTILPFGLYFIGVRLIRSTRALVTATLEPVSAGLMAYLFLGEDLTLPQIIGGALVIGAITMLQRSREGGASLQKAAPSGQ